MSKGGPNSGILIPFESPLVNHYKDVLMCCIIVNCMIRKFICYIVLFYCQILVARINVMLCYVTRSLRAARHMGGAGHPTDPFCLMWHVVSNCRPTFHTLGKHKRQLSYK